VASTVDTPRRSYFWPIVGIALVVQAVLIVDCARRWSPTHDEYWHLPIGLRMWQTGRLNDDVINPPPIRLLAAVPLALGGAQSGDLKSGLDVGDIGDEFWTANGDQAWNWFFAGRLMLLPLAAVTGLVVTLWARAWYGDSAALVSLLLWVCCPTVIANAALVTHDLPLAAAWMMALAALVRFTARPDWRRTVLLGLALGMAPLAKLTGLLLIPLSLVLWFLLPRRATDQAPTPLATTPVRWLGSAAAALGIALLVINAAYGFRGTGVSLNAQAFASPQLSRLQQSLSPVGWLPVLLPADFVGALDRLAQDLDRAHPVYLDGTWSHQPIPLYYLYALFYKVPMSTLLLIGVSLAGVIWPRAGSEDRRHGAVLLIAALLLPVLASRSSNQIGIRYVLPTLPVLFVFAGQSARWLTSPHRWQRWGVWGCLLLAPLSLRHHPSHLAYFNLLAGGPSHGGSHLVDSNIDWGQSLHELRAYLVDQKIEEIGLAYFGTVIPATIGIQSHRPPSGAPEPGWYAISVNFVNGRPHVLRDAHGVRSQVALDEFGYFRFFQPVARIGNAIYIYHLTNQDVARFALARQRMLTQ